jgi:hypothetical protein
MRNPLLFSALLIITCLTGIGCSKSDGSDGDGGGGGKYYVKFEIDGEKREYTGVTTLSVGQNDGVYVYQFTGIKAPNVIEGMSMTITTDKPITAPQSFKTVTWTPSGSTQGMIQLLLGIHDKDNTTYVSFVATGYDYPANATITEITSNHVKGTFNGEVTNSSFTKSKSITKGEFFLKRMN